MKARFVLALLIVSAAGCNGALDSHLHYAPAATPTPSPAPSSTGVAATCTGGGYALGPAPPGTVPIAFIDMTSQAGASTSSYGEIAGYIADSDIAGNTIPNPFPAASTISVSVGTPVVFFNIEGGGVHRAAGIAGSSFPASPTFVSGPTGSTLTTTGTWATGPIASTCYSGIFMASSAGVYYFGDPSAYASSPSVRDVIVVQ